MTGRAFGPALRRFWVLGAGDDPRHRRRLDYNNEPDLHMTTANTTVEVDAGAGDDLVDAFYNTDQLGEAGKDVLVGGKTKDGLFGLAGDDILFSDGDPGSNDIVAGGADRDRAKVDLGFDQFSSIEAFDL